MKLSNVKNVFLAFLGLALLESGLGAQETQVKKLNIGDAAPALQIEKWIKGEPVKGFEKGKVYVIEFWATWCKPCIQVMPHNTELQKKYKDKGLRVIGVTSKDPGNTLEKVEKMVAEKGDEKLGYTIAWDSGRKTNEAYMDASGQNGIPCAFIVNQEAKVVWIGHPAAMDAPLAKVMEGNYDVKAAQEAHAKELEQQKKLEELQPVFMSLQNAMRSQNWDEALKIIEEIEAKNAEIGARMAGTKFKITLLNKKDAESAYKLAATIVDKAIAAKESYVLNDIAWTIVDPDLEPVKRDLDLAMKAASKANEITENKDPMVLDTLARVYATKGDLAKAIELQKKALSLADETMQAEFKKTLSGYEEKAEKK